MKKSILQFSVIAAIAASMTLTTSCSSDESMEKPFTPEAMEFGVGIGKLAITRTVESWTGKDVTVNQKWKDGLLVRIKTKDGTTDDIKVYKTSSTGTTNETTPSPQDINHDGTDTETSVSTTKLVANGINKNDKFYWNSKTDTKEIRAWSYGTTNDPSPDFSSPSGTIFEIATDQTEGQSSEFLYAYQDLAYTNREKDYLVFAHQLALVEVTITTTKNNQPALTMGEYKRKGGTDPDADSNTSNNLIPIKATYTPPTSDKKTVFATPADGAAIGTWSSLTAYDPGTSTAANYGYIKPNLKTGIAGSTETYTTIYQAVMIPGSYVGMPMFVIDYDGAHYIYTGKAESLVAPVYPGDKLEANKKYLYSISISNQGLEVNATIKPWANAEGSYGGNAVLQ